MKWWWNRKADEREWEVTRRERDADALLYAQDPAFAVEMGYEVPAPQALYPPSGGWRVIGNSFGSALGSVFPGGGGVLGGGMAGALGGAIGGALGKQQQDWMQQQRGTFGAFAAQRAQSANENHNRALQNMMAEAMRAQKKPE